MAYIASIHKTLSHWEWHKAQMCGILKITTSFTRTDLTTLMDARNNSKRTAMERKLNVGDIEIDRHFVAVFTSPSKWNWCIKWIKVSAHCTHCIPKEKKKQSKHTHNLFAVWVSNEDINVIRMQIIFANQTMVQHQASVCPLRRKVFICSQIKI